MARNKTTENFYYELLYIISNKYSENEIKPIIEKVEKIIKKNDGSITLSEEWGKKRLAYPIKHFYHGYYILVEFDLEGEKLKNLDKLLRMSSEILRYQIIKKKQKTKEAIEKDEKIAEKIAEKKKDEEKKEDDEKKENKEKKKVDLKDLDEKLDKILESDNLL
ncbi:MAG: 30S ribosomal protein S6 [Candidatus Falkowbacteria bacterium]